MTTTRATSDIFSSRQLEFFDDENKNQSISIQIFEVERQDKNMEKKLIDST